MDDGGNCIAQNLADRLGVRVSAPSDTLFVNSDGSMSVGAFGDGGFVEFFPRRKR